MVNTILNKERFQKITHGVFQGLSIRLGNINNGILEKLLKIDVVNLSKTDRVGWIYLFGKSATNSDFTKFNSSEGGFKAIIKLLAIANIGVADDISGGLLNNDVYIKNLVNRFNMCVDRVLSQENINDEDIIASILIMLDDSMLLPVNFNDRRENVSLSDYTLNNEKVIKYLKGIENSANNMLKLAVELINRERKEYIDSAILEFEANDFDIFSFFDIPKEDKYADYFYDFVYGLKNELTDSGLVSDEQWLADRMKLLQKCKDVYCD